ncbi:PilN domain-containing protein [Actinoplanes sp. CA-142083]|uniref:PilN domain-containing protein n=1 Tax=Actinoplanes sp. CA-142083 TaxID=3239903 RepID=UPI003D915711
MSNSTTALMPLDPAVSPEHVNRVLPIRANLLPPEIMAGRNARRTRVVLAGAVAVVAVLLGGWYWHADKQRDLVNDDLASVTGQVDVIRKETRSQKYTKVTDAIETRDQIAADLKSALAKDLPWQTLLDSLRSTAAAKGVTLSTLSGALDADNSGATSTDTVGTLTITGDAKDKPTIAGFVDAVAKVNGMTDVYLTSATQKDGTSWTYTLTASIKTTFLCGRYSAKTCGGK